MRARLHFAVLMLAASTTALAAHYEIDPHYDGEPSGVCIAVKKALDANAIGDARKPVCQRRFEVTPRASKFELTPIPMSDLDLKANRNLLDQMFAISGQESWSHIDKHEQERLDALALTRISDGSIKVHTATFDADNSGSKRTVYVLDGNYCPQSETNLEVFIEENPGLLNPVWGISDYDTGYPFTYNRRTYYAKWAEDESPLNKRQKAILNIYVSQPDDAKYRVVIKFETFGFPQCIIHENK
jgi:hypothetical protein